MRVVAPFARQRHSPTTQRTWDDVLDREIAGSDRVWAEGLQAKRTLDRITTPAINTGEPLSETEEQVVPPCFRDRHCQFMVAAALQ